MRTVTDNSKEELANTLGAEIAAAREEARPISRLTLSRLLNTKHGLHLSEAEKFVDRYCDEKAPAIPTFLSSEFGTPYLKVLAVINIVLAIGFYIVSFTTLNKQNAPIWPWMLLGTIFLGASVVSWVQSLRPPKAARTVTRYNPEEHTTTATTGVESRDRAATGPLQPRS